jgi:LmbE family N-acetylglucosaminyl deacetylase
VSQRRVMFIGAHPDDADLSFGGTALQLVRAGHLVKFVSMTNGDTGHFQMSRKETAARRKLEAEASGRTCGLVEYEVMDNNCGLEPTVANREKILRVIRRFQPDIVLTNRTCDYHPDHRATAQLVMDTAYIVTVPHNCEDTPIPPQVPVYGYCYDSFEDPRPHRPDAAVSIDSVVDDKLNLLRCHPSQFYEWLPWNKGFKDFDVNKLTPEQERNFLLEHWFGRHIEAAQKARKVLCEIYGEEAGNKVQYAESFEFSPYGRQCSIEEFRRLLLP